MTRSLTLKGEPLSTQHIYGSTRRGGRYLKANARALKEDYGWQAKAQWKDKAWKEALYVEVHYYLGTKRKFDLDNAQKILLDSMNGIVWQDDSQITELHLFKKYDKANPRAEVHVTAQL